MRIWQTTELDHAVAEEFFGWKWIAVTDIPVRRTPGYPNRMRVRRFVPPDVFTNKRWKDYLAEAEVGDATGDEPLDYCYCSSNGPHMVPHFSGHRDAVEAMEKELRRRKLWDKYRKQLWAQVTGEPQPDDAVIDESRLAAADCESRCIAALAVVGSKHVEQAAN